MGLMQLSVHRLLTFGFAISQIMFGENLKHVGETASTNDDAMLWARADSGQRATHGSVVRADAQTCGRGRLGRDWISPPNLGLYLSLILRPQIEIAQVSQLTMLAALASADAIDQQTNLRAQVKWPNDIVLHDKKVGGILSEASFDQSNISQSNIEYSKLGNCGEKARGFFVVVGIGLNVNFDADDLPLHPKLPATSLKMESGDRVSIEALFRNLMCALQKRYDIWESGGWHDLRAEFQERDFLQAKTVKVESGSETFRGRAVGIDADGLLLVQSENRLRRVLAGDVTWSD